MLTMKAPRNATLAMMFAYFVLGAVVLAWMLSRTNAQFIPDNQLMHDYARVVAMLSLAFLCLSAVPMFRDLIPAAFFVMALVISAPSLFGQKSILESMSTSYMNHVITIATASPGR